MARYLVTRGIFLVMLELTVLRFAWTFNFDYAHFVLAGVIWMLGWSMVLLAPLVYLPTKAIGAIGLGIIFLQQVFQEVPRALPGQAQNAAGWFWEFLYPAGFKPWHGIAILYVLVPWVGVMAAGYAFGPTMMRTPDERRRLCLGIGLSATLLFVVVGSMVLFMNPDPRSPFPVFFQLLNQKKYPASQLYLLMTLGPLIALLPVAERARGWFADMLATFGRVPLFYYLLHIPAIHIAALAVTFLREGSVHPEWYAYAPFTDVPPNAKWSLPLLYLVFAVVVAILYFPCRWFMEVRARHREGWLRYL